VSGHAIGLDFGGEDERAVRVMRRSRDRLKAGPAKMRMSSESSDAILQLVSIVIMCMFWKLEATQKV
jgi:hypothetical protein